jgi:hypothetical protein
LSALESIFRDGKIIPNIGHLPETHGQSKISYGRHLGAVSLFDFDTADEQYILEHELIWGTVLTGRLPAGVLIRIRREALDRTRLLLPTEIPGGEYRLEILPDGIKRTRIIIPAVEALHIGPIPASAFSGSILTAKEDGEYLWQEVALDTNAFRVLSDISAKWNADHERRTAERHARGEHTWGEIVEASYAPKKR